VLGGALQEGHRWISTLLSLLRRREQYDVRNFLTWRTA